MFGRGGAFYQQKNEVHVRLEIVDAEPLEGVVFLAIGERISDLLNDARSFIPVRRANGNTVIVAKQHIVSIAERAAQPLETGLPPIQIAAKMRGKDNPYFVLQVAPDASMADIIASCQRLTNNVLPEKLADADVKDPDIKSALRAAQKILGAYKMILRERGLDKRGGSVDAMAPQASKKSRGAAG